MAFGRKKAESPSVNITQDNVVMLATRALSQRRANRVRLPIRCTFEAMLMNRWSQKAIVKMLGNMTGHEIPREPKDLTQDFNDSWHRNEDGVPVVPCRILKAAIVEGAISTGGFVSKAELKRELRVLGHTSPLRLKDGKPVKGSLEMDVRVARNQNGGPDIRSRAAVPNGTHADFVLDFPSNLSVDKVMAALTAAGDTIGLFDWRIERGGEWGAFSIEILENKQVERIIRESSIPEERYEIPEYLLQKFNAIPQSSLSDPAKKVKSLIGQNDAQHVAERKRGRQKKDAA